LRGPDARDEISFIVMQTIAQCLPSVRALLQDSSTRYPPAEAGRQPSTADLEAIGETIGQTIAEKFSEELNGSIRAPPNLEAIGETIGQKIAARVSEALLTLDGSIRATADLGAIGEKIAEKVAEKVGEELRSLNGSILDLGGKVEASNELLSTATKTASKKPPRKQQSREIGNTQLFPTPQHKPAARSATRSTPRSAAPSPRAPAASRGEAGAVGDDVDNNRRYQTRAATKEQQKPASKGSRR
jgi:hypothetical protein